MYVKRNGLVSSAIWSANYTNPHSRDPLRIPKVLVLLWQLWSMMPDMRLGQLLHYIDQTDIDMFYLEDDLLIAQIQKRLEEVRRLPDEQG